MKDVFFNPSFGNKPSLLVGREDVLTVFQESLDSSIGSRDRSLLILGQRGMGKTILLLKIAEMAEAENYVATRPIVASSGMLDKIIEQLNAQSVRRVNEKKVTGAGIGGLGFSASVQFQEEPYKEPSFSYQISRICSAFTEQNKGILFVIDEVQSSEPELREFIISLQDLIGQGLNVAVAFAGLPSTLSSTLNDKVLTFLNRSRKIHLNPLSESDIFLYYAKAFKDLDIYMSDTLCKRASIASKGSPYMMQLIGHNIIRCLDDEKKVREADLTKAIDMSKTDFYNDICATILKDVSEKDMEFLQAMAEDDGISKAADIVSRTGMSNSQYQIYKRRLVEAGLINIEKRAHVAFAVDYLREFIRDMYLES